MTELFRAVEQLLASRRLGEPVFLRCLLQAREPAPDPVARLAQLSGAIRRWFGVPPVRLYAAGQAVDGQLSVTLQFATGATGLAILAPSPGGAAGLDVLILGNHGAALHEILTGESDEGAAERANQDIDLDLQQAIQRSLDCGRPEALPPGAES
jgi:hypothetical protein